MIDDGVTFFSRLPDEHGYYLKRRVGEREIGVVALTFGRGRIVIGPTGALWYVDGW